MFKFLNDGVILTECSDGRISRWDIARDICEIAFSPFGRRTCFFTTFRMTQDVFGLTL